MQVFWIKTRVRQKEFSLSPTYTLPFARVSRVNVERLLQLIKTREISTKNQGNLKASASNSTNTPYKRTGKVLFLKGNPKQFPFFKSE